jgi:nitrogenase iron protein
MGKRIAIYGKGGIGKSTIASNISATLGSQGKKILQIGCDPKHDSTLVLTNEPIPPLLPMLESNDIDLEINDFVHSGSFGVNCIELGGPEPGIGCAGRGILKGIQVLEQYDILSNHYDLIIYDVLGDVVCGGFFAPLRNGTDEMYIVTSGEFNSLFAANNLCIGYVNNSFGNVKIGGLIGNCRGSRNEIEIINRFAETINLPIVAIIPRDNIIEDSTVFHKPVVSIAPGTSISLLFDKLSSDILSNTIHNIPKPMSLDELRSLYETLKIQ